MKFRFAAVLVILSLGSLFAGDTARSRSALGEKALRDGDHRAAVRIFAEALEENPRHLPALLGSGRAYLLLGDFERAAGNYEKVLELDADNLDAKIALGRLHTMAGDPGRSLALLKSALELDPGNLEASVALALRYKASGDLEAAEFWFRKALRQKRSHVPSIVGLARLDAGRGRFESAERLLEEALRLDSIRPETHEAFGETLLFRAFESRDENRKKDFLERARASYMTALSLRGSHVPTERTLALLDMHSGNFKDSLRRIRAILPRLPGGGRERFLAAYLNERTGGAEAETRRLLELALDAEPDASLFRFALEVRALDGESSSPLRRKLADYHYRRARYYEKTRREDRRRTHLRRALDLDPDHPGTLRKMLEIHRIRGDYEKFLTLLRRLRVLEPDNLRLRFRLENALLARRKSVVYRENLLSPEGSGEDATFERPPARVFIFNFAPLTPLSGGPGAGELFARSLEYHLESAAASRPLREALLERIAQAEPESRIFSPAGVYRPELIRFVSEFSPPVPFSVGGSFRETPEGFEATYTVYENDTGSLLDTFALSVTGPDAIHEISERAAGRIRDILPLSGKVVKTFFGGAYMNLGEVDGVEKGDEFTVARGGRKKARLRVEEVSTYVSRCVVLEGRTDTGDTSVP